MSKDEIVRGLAVAMETAHRTAKSKGFWEEDSLYVISDQLGEVVEAYSDLNKASDRCAELNQEANDWWKIADVPAFIVSTVVPSNTTRRSVAGKVALIHSEASEMLEAMRRATQQDEHCPGFTNEEVEWADTLIRLFDLGAAMGYSPAAVVAKMRYNESRPHMHGKKF